VPNELATSAGQRRSRRCLGCGSTLAAGEKHCQVCGETVPWRLTPFGVGAETFLVIALVLALTAGLFALRARGGPGLAP
jgi:hypothetical protein